MMKSLSLISTLLLLLLLPLLIAAEPEKALPNIVEPQEVARGGIIDITPGVPVFQPIKNVNDRYIQYLGRFAVDEYRNWAKTFLYFQVVYAGQYQNFKARGMINYRLHLKAIHLHERVIYNCLATLSENKTKHLELKDFVIVAPPVFQPIRNVRDPHIQHLGAFAVNEHNKQGAIFLRLSEVYDGQFQIVVGRGTNYKLLLTAVRGRLLHHCLATVHQGPRFLELKDFVVLKGL